MFATIDRIEGDVVVLQGDDGRSSVLARSRLPAAAREGDVVDLETLTVDAKETARRKEELRAIRARTKPPGDFEL